MVVQEKDESKDGESNAFQSSRGNDLQHRRQGSCSLGLPSLEAAKYLQGLFPIPESLSGTFPKEAGSVVGKLAFTIDPKPTR